MRGLSDAHHFRKMVAGTCMVLAPVLALVAGIVQPGTKLDEAKELAVVAGNLDAWDVAPGVALSSVVLAGPALVGLLSKPPGRGGGRGPAGGGPGGVGA